MAELNRRCGADAGDAVLAWGWNECQQLGVPGLEGSGTNTYDPRAVRLPAGVAVWQVAAGSVHSVPLARDGTPYTWYVRV